jgi:hypothetical protein
VLTEGLCHIERLDGSVSTVTDLSPTAVVESGLETTELGVVEPAAPMDAVEEADDGGPDTEGVPVVGRAGAGDKCVRTGIEETILRLWRLIG